MCATKTLLKSFVDSKNPSTTTCLLYIIVLKEK